MIKNSQKDEALLYLTEFFDLYMLDMVTLQKQLPYAYYHIRFKTESLKGEA